jgi:signal transduction histidine kinase
LIATWQEATGIVVTFTANIDAGQLSNELATALFRIVEEVLTNVVKHARARHVSIVLTRQHESVVTIIEDDGQGFDPATPGGGFGLEHVRERLALLDGRLQIESSGVGSSGTTIVIEAPLF